MNKEYTTLTVDGSPNKPESWPDPTSEMLRSPVFEAIWQRIKTWDINVPEVYCGYCGATGNHVRAIIDALKDVKGYENICKEN